MDALQLIENALDDFVGKAIDSTSMSDVDKQAIKDDLLDIQERLVRNGLVTAHQAAAVLSKVLLSRLGL